ncbi:ATP-binding protein [Phyllobacterium sp. OV277]|uniref:sensor histidine kinase n=1 Tax=Phyllobacterium sp. OV277 TaxID=1882772 RepID=UPI000885AAD7|nr:ATP-binding protein [Phyllobacterium sp. OV277]SDP69508.1 Signal transduction histidine kinase [Phyllobacterium sp. OV277]
MRLIELIHTTSFRLAIAFLVLFAVASGALFAFLSWETRDFLTDRTDEWLLREAGTLSALDDQTIISRLSARESLSAVRERPISLFDPQGHLLAGSTMTLPVYDVNKSNPHNFATKRADERAHFRGLVKRLSSGNTLLIAQDVGELREFNDVLTNAMILGAAVTAALGLLGAAFIGAGSVRQIHTISDVTRNIMSGDLTQRLPVLGGSGDVRRLVKVVNSMLDEIERLMHEVKGVCDNIAHDMRTPLTRMLAGLERARRRAVTADEYADYVDGAIVETQGMLKTFSALLRISEIEDGARRAGFVSVDMRTVISDAVELYEPLAEEREIRLSVDFGEVPVRILGDPSLLFEAVGNLIDNAIKFTPRGGAAKVTLEGHLKRPRLTVEDNGQGIPSQEKELVLKRFHRGEKSRHEPGNGLGLSLVAAIARLHRIDLSFGEQKIGCKIVLEFNHNEQGRALSSDTSLLS